MNFSHDEMNPFFCLANYEDADVVEIPLIDNIQPRKDFMPMAVPEDIANRLIRLHGNPFVWFTGQLIKYMLRPQSWLLELLEKKSQAMDFKTPIVGFVLLQTQFMFQRWIFLFLLEFMSDVPIKLELKLHFMISPST